MRPPRLQKLAWFGGFIFALIFPFLALALIAVVPAAQGSWLRSIGFARLALLSGVPLALWLLYRARSHWAIRALGAVLVLIIYSFFSLTVHETGHDI